MVYRGKMLFYRKELRPGAHAGFAGYVGRSQPVQTGGLERRLSFCRAIAIRPEKSCARIVDVVKLCCKLE